MKTLTKPRWELAEAKANELSELYSAPPIPVLEIAESNGVNVVFVNFGKYSEDVSGLCDFAKKRIYVNENDNSVRQTFTIAHELGHWILHRDFYSEHPEEHLVLPRFSEPDKNDVKEKEANKFATCLLVPVRLLRPVKGAAVSSLADIFGVSRTMMEYRIKNV